MASTTHIVTREEIDALPTVAPLLAQMRQAKADLDSTKSDRRSGRGRIAIREQAFARASEDYNVVFVRERNRLYAERYPVA